MKIYKLGEICNINSGGTPSRKESSFYGGDILWAKISDIENANNGIITNTEEKITESGLLNIRNKLFPKNTLLLAMYGSVGKVAITGKSMSTNQAILGIRPKNPDIVNLTYLKYWIKVKKSYLLNRARGVTLKNLSATIIRDLQIPLPSLEDQLRIANILSRAEGLIAQRKESIQLLDELLKSTFLDMFGDPVRNEKGWEKETLDNLVAKDCPLTYGIVQPGEEFTDGVPVVRPIDLTQTYVDIDGLKRINPKISEKFSRTILRGNEILMCVRGVTGIISRSTENLKGCNVTRGITPIWFDEHYNLLFAFNLLQSKVVNNEIQKLTYGATLRQINLRDLRKLELINPPILKQNEFAQIVEKVEIIKTKYQESLQELENLYASLSQKAFKGELDLSKMEIKDYYLGHAEPEDPDSYREAAEDGAEYNKQL